MIKNCQIRREYIKYNNDKLQEEQINALVPENSIQYLIHYYGYNDKLTSDTIEDMNKIMMFMIENVIENNNEGINIIEQEIKQSKKGNK